jgi:hypothetical protein
VDEFLTVNEIAGLLGKELDRRRWACGGARRTGLDEFLESGARQRPRPQRERAVVIELDDTDAGVEYGRVVAPFRSWAATERWIEQQPAADGLSG